MKAPIAPSGTHLWLVLMKAHRALEQAAMASIAATGLCFTDFALLEVLLHKGPLPVNTIGAKVHLSSAAATAAVDRLERRGLVRRVPDADDRRARRVHLTRRGEDLIGPLFRRHQRDLETAMAGISQAEKAQLVELLRKLGKGVTGSTVES